MKPEKYTWAEVLKKLAKPIKHKMVRIKWKIIKIMGFWYCAACGKYHSARVKRYDVTDGISDDVCSIGLEVIGKEASEWKFV